MGIGTGSSWAHYYLYGEVRHSSSELNSNKYKNYSCSKRVCVCVCACVCVVQQCISTFEK